MFVTGFPAGSWGTNCYAVATAEGEDCLIVDPGQASTPPTTTTTAITAMMRLRVLRRWADSARRAACRSALARATSRLRLLDVTVTLLLGCLHTDA